MPRLLALDTSTEACSVALLLGDAVDERFVVAPREHMLRLLPMVDELLAAHNLGLRDLDAIAFGRGPGSFTGLRICLGIAQGLAFGAGLPLIPVSSLAALAQSAVDAGEGAPYLLAMIDARMDEVYRGWFRRGDNGLVEAVGDEAVLPPEAVADVVSAAGQSRAGIGSGCRYLDRMAIAPLTVVDPATLPHAAAVARLALPRWRDGRTVPADAAVPVYLRDQVAWK